MKNILNFLKIKKRTQEGFTLVESLVSIALILIAVIGPLSLTINSINTIRQNRSRVIASYLAEEIVEDLRAYRDGFVLACRDIQVDINPSTLVATPISCITSGGNNIGISQAVISQIDPGSYTSETIGWGLFIQSLEQLPLNTNTAFYLDRSSFSYLNLSDIAQKSPCEYLYLDSNNTYTCSSSNGPQTDFSRSVIINKLPNNSIKVEVEVIYTKSLFGLNNKSVKVIDYIYER